MNSWNWTNLSGQLYASVALCSEKQGPLNRRLDELQDTNRGFEEDKIFLPLTGGKKLRLLCRTTPNL